MLLIYQDTIYRNSTKIKIELGWSQIIISDKGRKKTELRERN